MNVHEGLVTIQRLRFSELNLHSALTWRAAVWFKGHCGELCRKQLVFVLL